MNDATPSPHGGLAIAATSEGRDVWADAKARLSGWIAYCNDQSESSNPHAPGTTASNVWLGGYRDAKRSIG